MIMTMDGPGTTQDDIKGHEERIFDGLSVTSVYLTF